MKTAAEMLDRMEALCRKMAAQFSEANSKYNQAPYLGSTLVYIDAASYREDCAIVSELPEPVDPDTLKARQIIGDEYGSTRMADGSLSHGEGPARVEAIKAGKGDEYWEMRVVKAALRRARDEGVK